MALKIDVSLFFRPQMELAVRDEAHGPVSALLAVFVRFAIKWHNDFHKAGI